MPLACVRVSAARVCRRCRESEPKVRFSRNGLASALCVQCQSAEAARRGMRRVERSGTPTPRPRKCRIAGDTEHLAWIRSLPCAAGQPRCGTLIHAHHVRERSGGGTGMKPPDRWTVPLCPAHHVELHTSGAVTFGLRYGVDLRALAVRLAAASPFPPRDE